MSSFNISDTWKIYITTMKNLPVSYSSLPSDIFKLVAYENFRDIPGIDSINVSWDNVFADMASFQLDFAIGFSGGLGTKISNYNSIEFDLDSIFIRYDRAAKLNRWLAITVNTHLINSD